MEGETPPPVLEEPAAIIHVEEDEELGIKDVRVEVTWGGREPGTFVLTTAIGRAGLYR